MYSEVFVLVDVCYEEKKWWVGGDDFDALNPWQLIDFELII